MYAGLDVSGLVYADVRGYVLHRMSVKARSHEETVVVATQSKCV